jgi:beta-1,4-mannosyltransferase
MGGISSIGITRIMREINVCSVPYRNSKNPYISMINEELRRVGVHFEAPIRKSSGIMEWPSPGTILHFHWPSNRYTADTRAGTEKAVTEWAGFLDDVISRGCKVVWTAHNLVPHENPFPDLEKQGQSILVSRCHHIITHCKYAKQILLDRYRVLPEVSVIAHPSFASVYPHPSSRVFARRYLKLSDDDFVVVIFGQIREYKGIEWALSAISRLDSQRLRVLVVGEPGADYDIEQLKSLAERDERVSFVPGSMPSEVVAVYFGAADASLHCYKRILTSGSIALAQSMGRAVIAPRLGCIEEMVPPPCGILYQPGSDESLLSAMQQTMLADVVAMGQHGRSIIERQSPAQFAMALLDIYKSLEIGCSKICDNISTR